MMTDAFRNYIEPARARPALWRLIAGCVTIAVIWFLTGLAILVIGSLLPPPYGWQFQQDPAAGQTPMAMAVLFLTFFGLLLGTILAARLWHRRGLRSLLGTNGRLWRDFSRVAALTLALYLAALLPWALFFDPVPNMEPGRWVWLLPLGLAGLAVQTLAEELAFRGYLMQQLAARFRSPWVWMGLPTLGFGLLHFTPEGGWAVAALIVVATGTFGLIAADLTRRTGSLGAAWGMHMANNVLAILIISVDGTLPGLALWRTPYGLEDAATMVPMLFGDIVMLALAWLLIRRVLRL